jgi:hypothetical protein
MPYLTSHCVTQVNKGCHGHGLHNFRFDPAIAIMAIDNAHLDRNNNFFEESEDEDRSLSLGLN